ncbi:MAG: class I tRNA ligase family protein, partial [Parcubacteria group bacterium]|nr:class I tRNA ligase family protein [Parcubacteria group bacterium]
MELPKAYNPKDHERETYRLWEASGFFNPDQLPERHKQPFAVVMAPPNITGSLHMGHALEYTISDILIRRMRMRGFRTLWLPGTDHAGIATQNVVEKELKKKGKTRHDIGREKFLERIWEWKETYGDIILQQLKMLGASADWSRTRFTMDPAYQTTVEKVFLHYYEKGWIYKGKRTVNWCARCATSLSDLEVEYREEQGTFYFITYGPVTIGTVRPETKLGDTALAVHPDDERYREYHGKEITIQSVDSSLPRSEPPRLADIRIRVIADEAVDPSFGSGVIKVTPAHDTADFEISQRHPEIPVKKVIGEDGRMTAEAGIRYQGLRVREAREQIVRDLGTLGLIEKSEAYTHNVAMCYRCETVLEPLLSEQWFLKMETLAKYARDAVRSGKITFHPRRWEKIYLDWLDSIRDWCISRQLWWGHKIPLAGVSDVLDTWFSSALWPFVTLGWPHESEDLKRYYPTSVLTNDRGIINLWDARMAFSGIEFMGEVPFRQLIIHATILTREGKRMSKSLGTGVDPLQLIERYGADATRFGLVWQAMGGQDIRWAEEHVIAGKKFLNKLWNASRFVLRNIETTDIA